MLKTKNRPSRSLSHGDVSGDSNTKSTNSATSGLFGRELADVILESGIPAIVEDCIAWIEAHGSYLFLKKVYFPSPLNS